MVEAPRARHKVWFSAKKLSIEVPRYDESRYIPRDERVYHFECEKCKKIQSKTFYYGKCSCGLYVCVRCHWDCEIIFKA